MRGGETEEPESGANGEPVPVHHDEREYSGELNLDEVGPGLPVESLRKLNWNWGAVLLPELWGPAHGLTSALLLPLMLGITHLGLPLFLLGSFYFGYAGHSLAWSSDRFENPRECNDCQRSWAVWGAVILPIRLALLCLLIIIAASLYTAQGLSYDLFLNLLEVTIS